MARKLLVVTQKVDKNDSVLGFFHAWLVELAANVDQLTVIAKSVGSHALPKNVTVLSLGKDAGKSRFAQLKLFFWYIADRVNEYDAVFVHMNPEYVALAGAFWRMHGKRIALWYTHRAVTIKLRAAVRFAHAIFTASKEGCRVGGAKVHPIGHGIDVALFSRELRHRPVGAGEGLRVVHIGRITPIKNCDTIIDAVALVRSRLGRPVSLSFVGAPATHEDESYARTLIASVRERGLDGVVGFTGAMRHEDLPVLFSHADVSINATPTGGLDKAVIESMAAGVPAFTSNQAFRTMLGPDAPVLSFRERDAEDLAAKLVALFADPELPALVRRLRKIGSASDIRSVISTIVGSLFPHGR